MFASIETDFANTKTLCNFVELFCFAPPLFLFFKLVSPEFHVSNVAAKKDKKIDCVHVCRVQFYIRLYLRLRNVAEREADRNLYQHVSSRQHGCHVQYRQSLLSQRVNAKCAEENDICDLTRTENLTVPYELAMH